MAEQTVTTTPTALAGVVAGTQYSIQNQGREPVLVATVATAPSADSGDAGIIPARAPGSADPYYVSADSGEEIFVWVRPGYPHEVPGPSSKVFYEDAT